MFQREKSSGIARPRQNQKVASSSFTGALGRVTIPILPRGSQSPPTGANTRFELWRRKVETKLSDTKIVQTAKYLPPQGLVAKEIFDL